MNALRREALEVNGLFLKISPGGFVQASRNKRELSVVRDLGLATLVMTKGELRGNTVIDGWAVLELSTRPLGGSPGLVHLNRLASSESSATPTFDHQRARSTWPTDRVVVDVFRL